MNAYNFQISTDLQYQHLRVVVPIYRILTSLMGRFHIDLQQYICERVTFLAPARRLYIR